MLASVERSEALQLLKLEHAEVKALIDELSDEEMTRPDTIKHGLYSDQQCSFKDLLAHLICYEVYAIEAVHDWKTGNKHPVIDAMKDYRESTKIHYGGIADRAHLTLEEQLDEWEQVRTQLESIFDELTDEEWRGQAPYPVDEPTDVGGMLERIIVAPPRPMYRHLPVHIPDSSVYISQLRARTFQS